MADLEHAQRLRTHIAEILSAALRDGGHAGVELFWSEIAGSSFATMRAFANDGSVTDVRVPNSIFDAMEGLRVAMVTPSQGTWLSVVVSVDGAGVRSFEFNADRRPYWNSPTHFDPTERDLVDPNPSDEAFIEDLEQFPRAAGRIPDWYPTRPGTERAAPTGRPELAAALGTLDRARLVPPELTALLSNDDWGPIIGSIRDELVAALPTSPPPLPYQHDGVASLVYIRVFDRYIEPYAAGVVKRIWAPANAAAGYPPKSLDVADDEPAADPSDDFVPLLEDISDVMGTIVDHQLAVASGIVSNTDGR